MTAPFHKIDQKTLKRIILGFNFATFVSILPKLRYFEGKNDIQIGYIKLFSTFVFPIDL